LATMVRKKRRQLKLVPQVKDVLAKQIIDLLSARQLTQTQAAALLETQQPRVSDLIHMRLDKFSIDMLVTWLDRLEQQITLDTAHLIEYSTDGTRKPVRLLLIEDNDDDYDLLLEQFEQTRGLIVEVSRASSLKEAAETFSKTKFDAVLLDLGLPDGHGIETYKMARATLSTTIPIIVLTWLADPSLPVELVGLGAENYLSKGQPRIGYQLARTLFNALAR
jgi:predicted XRE-type DNA-binding protein/CheY-like chemotaxis protein